MPKPSLLDSFVYEGKTINVAWFEVASIDDLPEVSWQQVYAIAKLDGMVALVVSTDGQVNLPGGKTEPGESIEETLRRELQEEMNCRVSKWSVIGYQRLTNGNNNPIYQLRVYAELERIGAFKSDPAGKVVGQKLVLIGQLNQEIGYGALGERMIEIMKPNFI
jgi:8-oxo-dGTP pyrophosphatase MutT (NUDIX family)